MRGFKKGKFKAGEWGGIECCVYLRDVNGRRTFEDNEEALKLTAI